MIRKSWTAASMLVAAPAQIPVLMLFVTRSGYFAAAASGRGADGRWPKQPQGH